jgi:hypothetical protein
MKWHGGKGSKQRTVDYASYNNNYDKIFEKKMGRETLQWDVHFDEYVTPSAVDLHEGDVIEWIKINDKTVEITVVKALLISETFQVPADVFEGTYKPAFK